MQIRLTLATKLFFNYQKRRNSLRNNEKQPLPLKMSKQSHFPNNALTDNGLQKVDFVRVYV